MELEEMEKRLNIAKQEIYNLEEEIRQLKEEKQKQQGRWKPKYKEEYWYVDESGYVENDTWTDCTWEEKRYKIHNVFRTKAEAQARADKIKIYWQLYDLAERLNKGEKIDWEDDSQPKYNIGYDYDWNQFDINAHYTYKEIGQIYCLDENFLDKAIEEIRRR